MIYLNAGDLDQFITLQQRAAGQNAHGQASGAWGNVSGLVDIRARADTRQGGDGFGAGQDRPTSQVTFRMRWSETRWTTIKASMRVMWRGKAHEIVGEPINVKGADVAIDLMCVAGTGDGLA